MPKSRASLCGSPRRALAGPAGARGPYATGATATTALWSAKRGRARISPRASPREAQFVRRLSPLPPTRKTTKLLVFDLGDARNAGRRRRRLRLSGRRRVREARLHLQDRAPHPVDEALFPQIIALLQNLLEDERRRAF